AGILIIIIVLPIDDTLQGQLLSLIGILLTAAIALSSTTFVGNIMAGMMLRAVRNFRLGDFVRVGEYFGRVSERGLFHVEIQNEDRDLTTLPNLYLIANPVKVVRSSGTFISAEISLGYDISHNKVEEILIKAAKSAQLKDPFMLILELGDFSITYRISGLLEEVKHTLSTRSLLREMMLDELHDAGVEIVSPNFMNTRALSENQKFIPTIPKEHSKTTKSSPEPAVFDKAEEAESAEKLVEKHKLLTDELKQTKDQLKHTQDGEEKDNLKAKIEMIESRIKWLSDLIKQKENGANNRD
ncbi:MAG: mechanosensitive ion channel, partial [candidate division Zixibacteria bacterium]|nr:mechanosensitive ion channel [candidate division Zixibacteria bacterium]